MTSWAASNWGSDPGSFPPEVRGAYVEALPDGGTVHAVCEEYRAAATVDVADDEEDRRLNRQIMCPALVLWSGGSALDTWVCAGGPGRLASGRTGRPTSGAAIAGGHFFPEQNAAGTVSALRSFLGR